MRFLPVFERLNLDFGSLDLSKTCLTTPMNVSITEEFKFIPSPIRHDGCSPSDISFKLNTSRGGQQPSSQKRRNDDDMLGNESSEDVKLPEFSFTQQPDQQPTLEHQPAAEPQPVKVHQFTGNTQSELRPSLPKRSKTAEQFTPKTRRSNKSDHWWRGSWKKFHESFRKSRNKHKFFFDGKENRVSETDGQNAAATATNANSQPLSQSKKSNGTSKNPNYHPGIFGVAACHGIGK